MEVTEIGVRLLRRYWFVLLLAIAVPAAIVAATVIHQPATYTAHARVIAASAVPQAQAQADAIVSEVQAVATSRDVVTTALEHANLDRDPGDVLKRVQVTGLGSSGIADIAYTDSSAVAAQQITAALAEAVADRMSAIYSGLPASIDDLDTLLTTLSAKRDAVAAAVPGTVAGPSLAKYDRLIGDLGASRDKLARLAGTAGAPTVVDAPAIPHADSPGLTVKIGVTFLLGLAIGLLLIGLSETLRPGVSGAARVARLLSVPGLGRIGSEPAALADVGLRLRLASRRESIGTVVLMRADAGPVSPELVDRVRSVTLPGTFTTADLTPTPDDAHVPASSGDGATPVIPRMGVTQKTRAKRPTAQERAAAQRRAAIGAQSATGAPAVVPAQAANVLTMSPAGLPAQVCAFGELGPDIESDSVGLVILAGRTTRLTSVEAVRDLAAATGWPLLGVLDDAQNRSGV